MAINKAIV